MKKFISLFVLAVVFLFSCKKEDPIPEKTMGRLIVDVGLIIQVEEVVSRLKSSQAIEDFKVTIYHSDGSEAMSFQTYASMPDTIELIPGDYYVQAHSDNDLPAAFENPYYFGESDVITLNSNMQEAVQISCSLANTMVSVSYSNRISSDFTDYTTTVSTGTDSLVYTKDETRTGYFQPLPLNIKVMLNYLNPDGSSGIKVLTGSIPEPASNRHYQINVDASVDQGLATFQILLDDTEVPTEIVEVVEQDNNPPEGAIAYGELLITEIMANPSALSDSEGEWFEIYNATDHNINLQNLILQRNGTDIHTIADEINLAPGEYHAFTRSENALNISNSYSYGTDISLTNSGAVLGIYNEGTEDLPGPVIFSVDYGSEGFPSGNGSSIILNPLLMDPAEAVLGSSWCVSSSAYSSGDLGTPGSINDNCE